VAVDAFTVYRGMDIGTAKPSAAQRRLVPHHMIDVLDPSERCTVQWFQTRARVAIAEVRSRGRVPLLVGGSGLYYRAVVDDLRFPPTDPQVRARIASRFAGDAAAAHQALVQADPAAAARIEPGNLRRSVRALEVIALTDEPFSAWRTDWEAYRSRYADLRVVGVAIDRQELDRRIAQRAADMVARGLLTEAARLDRAGMSDTARAAIGYAEALAHLHGGGEDEAAELVEAIRLRTRRYAVRQQRWFAADPRIRWVDADRAVQEVRAWSS
jgi:tRNA dimethylallyltransferase